MLRDGFSYVFKVGADNKVTQVKVDSAAASATASRSSAGSTPTRAWSPPAAASWPTATLVRVVDAPAAMAAGAASAARATPPKP